MRIQYIPSASDTDAAYQFLTSFIINDHIAIDAGAIGLVSPPSRQKQIRHVFLSHSHIDHVATLPMFLHNAYDPPCECVRLYASQFVHDCLRRDMFNGHLWPDLIKLSDSSNPLIELIPLQESQPVQIGTLQITPISVDHVVPCFAFLLEEPGTTAAIITDTGPTQAVWKKLRSAETLAAVFLEASFPQAFQSMAEKSKHLTTSQFLHEITKLDQVVPLYAIHLKAEFHDQIVCELQALGLDNLEIAQPGREYLVTGTK